MSRTADKKNRGLIEYLSICQVLCARELLFWSLCGDGASWCFLKVSNRVAVGEYPEKLGFLSPFCSRCSHRRGRGWGGWK